jgi:hypothetical protein
LPGESAFHKFLDEPERLTVPMAEKDLKKLLDADPKLKAAVEGMELVPVKLKISASRPSTITRFDLSFTKLRLTF